MLGSIIVPTTWPLLVPSSDYNLGPEWLTKELIAIFGAELIGLYIGEDLVFDSTDNATLWPSRVGPQLSRVGTGYAKRSLTNSRIGATFANTATNCKYDSGSSAVAKSLWSVIGKPALPCTNYYNCFRVFASPDVDATAAIQIILGASALFTGGGWTHYVNGISTTSLSDGLNIIESSKSTNAYPGWYKGYDPGGYNWPAPDCCKLVFSAVPTPVKRARAVVALSRYYSLPITADVLKVASLPVDNPVIVAPLRTAFQSYGTVNAPFTLVGSPTIGVNGASFNGVDQAAIIDPNSPTDYTLVTRAKVNSLANLPDILVSVQQPTVGLGGWGIQIPSGSLNWALAPIGSSVIYSTTAYDQNLHTFTVKRSGVTTTFYLDGLQILTSVLSWSGGTQLILAAHGSNTGIYPGTWSACNHKHSLFYNTALSAGDQALLEAWAAQAA